MTVYRRKIIKPVEIEAVQWRGNNTAEVKEWVAKNLPHLKKTAVFVPRRSAVMTEKLFANLIPHPRKEVTAAVWLGGNWGGYVSVVDNAWIFIDVDWDLDVWSDKRFRRTFDVPAEPEADQ